MVLVDITREAAVDLIGRRGGEFVASAVLGLVGERVVRRAPCDVLAVA